jgi:Na+-translocating ferredoxin:NAD+ oxidoreductase RnfD subunit
MTVASLHVQTPRSLARFGRSPKGLLLGIFTVLAFLAAASLDGDDVAMNLALAVVTAAAVDLAVMAMRRKAWVFPDGAILTGLIVAFVLRPQEPAAVLALSIVVGLASKHLLRTRWSNVLNPAAVSLVFAGLVLNSGQSWWGALPGLGATGALAVLALGVFITDRINKLPMVLVFLGAYFALFTVAGIFGDSATVAEVFRTPDIQAVLFFALFMLDDPPTSPVRYEDQVVYGLIVATVAYFVYMSVGVVYYLPLALLAGNAWESGRRMFADQRRSRLMPA